MDDDIHHVDGYQTIDIFLENPGSLIKLFIIKQYYIFGSNLDGCGKINQIKRHNLKVINKMFSC